jgi:hypothetical protein
VTAGGGKLERAPRALLTSNVCEVECREMRTVSVRGRGYERRRIVLPAQIADGLREVVQRHRLDPCERRLRRRFGGAQEAF